MSKSTVKLICGLLLTCIFTVGLSIFGSSLGELSVEEYSETFNGAVSSVSYNTKEELVRGFVTDELTGDMRNPVYLSHEVLNSLTREEIESLNLSDEMKGNIASAERVAVHYSETGTETDTPVAKTLETFILTTSSNEYYYYVDLPEVGEPLTASYFETVFDGNKYINCTSTTILDTRVIRNGVSTVNTYSQTIKFADDIAYFDQQIPGYVVEMYITEESFGLDVYITGMLGIPNGEFKSLHEYNEESIKNNNTYYYVAIQKGGEQVDVAKLGSMSEVTDLVFLMDVDASYFVKTDFGFSMPHENYMAVCEQMMDPESFRVFKEQAESYNASFSSDYYVSEGRLSGSETLITTSNGSELFSLSIRNTYTDFGTTEVAHPTKKGDNVNE